MESKNLNGKLQISLANLRNSDDESSSNDSNYESIRDNNNFMEQTDSADDVYQPIKKRFTGKRLQTFDGGMKLRNDSISFDEPKNGKIIERMPTRKPNPKIFNRNALMARENRRRKKEHMESLERTMNECQRENKKLRKMLKNTNNLVSKLKHERLYLKSVIANKSEIVTLLQSFKNARMPITSSVCSFITGNSDGKVCNSPINDRLDNILDNFYTSEDDNGTVPLSNVDLSVPLFDTNFSFTDLLLDYPCSPISSLSSPSSNSDLMSHIPATPLDNWETIINDEAAFVKSDITTDYIPTTLPFKRENSVKSIDSEHNYFSNNSSSPASSENNCPASSLTMGQAPGICLHVSSGRVSLEFCAACHHNSQNAWIEEV